MCPPSQDDIDSLQRNLDWKVFRYTGREPSCSSEESDGESGSPLDLSAMPRTGSTPSPQVVMPREAGESCDTNSRITEAAPFGVKQGDDVGSVVHRSRRGDDVVAGCTWGKGGEGEFGVHDSVPEACSGTGDGGASAMTTMENQNEVFVLTDLGAQGTGEAASGNLMRSSSDDSLLRELLFEGLGDGAGEPYQGTC